LGSASQRLQSFSAPPLTVERKPAFPQEIEKGKGHTQTADLGRWTLENPQMTNNK
jgi:hypothetical protein